MHDLQRNGFILDPNVGHAPAGRVTRSQNKICHALLNINNYKALFRFAMHDLQRNERALDPNVDHAPLGRVTRSNNDILKLV